MTVMFTKNTETKPEPHRAPKIHKEAKKIISYRKKWELDICILYLSLFQSLKLIKNCNFWQQNFCLFHLIRCSTVFFNMALIDVNLFGFGSPIG